MSEKKPIAILETRARNNCPVCGKPSYSATGTHPQCAMARADALSRENLKKNLAEKPEDKRTPWSKPCPSCNRKIPVRRAACECGHKFVAAFPAK
jgi:predicted RNA-binding Zn-ribbon protein involved in translation (DUF1610 family)